MGVKGQHPLAARIKRLMQSDEDVGKIAQQSPSIVGPLLLTLFEWVIALAYCF